MFFVLFVMFRRLLNYIRLYGNKLESYVCSYKFVFFSLILSASPYLCLSVCPSVCLSHFFRYHMYIIQIEITLRAPKALPTLSLLLSYAALVHDMNLIYTSSFRGRIIFMVLDFVALKQVQNHSSA